MNKHNIASLSYKISNKEYILQVFLLMIAIFFATQILQAQVSNSMYSMFGVGQLSDNNFGINKSLGGTGIAFQSDKSMNYLNPASYIGIPQSSYIMEAGIYGIYTRSESKNTFQTSGKVNLSYFSASFYFSKWWASSFGMTPFSSMNYEIHSTDEINGEIISFDKTYRGEGGLNRIYLGNSFMIVDGLSLGFNASYIVGPITQTETAASNSSFSGYELKNERTASSFYIDFGLQYSLKNNDWLYSLGLIYGPAKKLNTDDELSFTYNGTTSSLEQEKQLDIKIPEKFGIGLAIMKGENLKIGFDYELAKWSNINFSNVNLKTQNSSRFSIGLEYNPDQGREDIWYRKLSYRFGANYKNTYLKIENSPIDSKAINIGVGIPYDYTSTINLALEYGQEGTLSKGLVKNNYWQFYISYSLPAFWSNKTEY